MTSTIFPIFNPPSPPHYKLKSLKEDIQNAQPTTALEELNLFFRRKKMFLVFMIVVKLSLLYVTYSIEVFY
jgi:hypothetical protein